MTATVRAGERGFDSSFSHPPVQRTVDFGFTFRVGYISVPPASPGKNITIAECVETINAGQDLLLVWEMNASRATLGEAFGAIDGQAAKQEAIRRGQPTDVPILVADDTSTTVTNLPKKMAYMRAFAANCKPFDIGIYGGVKILAPLAGLWRIGWVPVTAWSWSVSIAKLPNETTAAYNARGRAACIAAARDIGAHVLQYTGFYIDNTWAVDPNEAIADFPAWGLHHDPPAPQPPVPASGDDMLRLLAPSDSPARFYAMCTPQGAALRCEWTGDGTDPAVVARMSFYEAAHPVNSGVPYEMSLTVGALINVSLDGPLPPGFTAEQFGNPDEIHTRAAAAGGTVDTAARAQIIALNDSVGRLGQRQSSAGADLVKAGNELQGS